MANKFRGSMRRKKGFIKRLGRSIFIVICLTIAWSLQPIKTECTAADFELISVDKLKTMLDDQIDVIVVDTRSEQSYVTKHIPGAVSMPYPDGIRAKNRELPRDKMIIFY